MTMHDSFQLFKICDEMLHLLRARNLLRVTLATRHPEAKKLQNFAYLPNEYYARPLFCDFSVRNEIKTSKKNPVIGHTIGGGAKCA